MLKRDAKAVVTGAGSGLGRALALELGARGGEVVISDIDEAGLAETRRLAEAAGRRVHVEPCDVARADDVERLRDRALSHMGGVDFVANNAGVAVGGAVGGVPLADWHWIMGVNLWGVIHGCHSFVPLMREQGHGHVLNVASIAGVVYSPEMGPYNVTKAAVVALTETLSAELRDTDVGATVLCPYFFETNIHRSARRHTERVSTEVIDRAMKKTKEQAADVAKIALAACDRGDLFCFPHKEAKVMQGLKRLSPSHLPKLYPMMERLLRRG